MKIDIIEVVEHGTDLDNTAMLQRLQSKGVQYVICHTVQTPVATMLTDAQRLGSQPPLLEKKANSLS